MRLDAHQHFWRYTAEEFGGLTDEMAGLRRDFLPEDLEPELRANGVDGTIAVQARQTVEETHWLLELAAQHAWIRGVVGWVDLRAENVRDELALWAPNRKLIGVRHIVQAEPEREFLLREDFQRGIAALEEFGLAYDLLLFPKHLGPALKLVKAFPRQRFVLDHVAKPVIRAGLLEPWATELKALAAQENVSCKLSGLVTEARLKGWAQSDIGPYLEVALEAFGPKRLMIGSDWPVCLAGGSYAETTGVVRAFIARLSADEQADVLGGTCARAYGVA
ncbi:MAG: amidohydrolase family protein [Terracidiphilus sp.]|nr:amidohydrolase family protein [Terracidiphilus sp.]